MARNMLAWGNEWLANQLKTNAAETVTYRRGAYSLATLSATVSNVTFDLQDAEGFTFQWEGTDFQVLADDLIISGINISPEQGDLIERTINSEVHQYEVQPAQGQSCFTVDSTRTRFRIHSKLRSIG